MIELRKDVFTSFSEKSQASKREKRFWFLSPVLETIPSDCVKIRVKDAIEQGKETIDLGGCGLIEIEESILDLNHGVSILGKRIRRQQIKLFLSNNFIHQFPSTLLLLRNLSVLSLRNNNIQTIPQEIYQLCHLEEFSLGGNQIEWLPFELKFISKLKNVSTRPNPFWTAHKVGKKFEHEIPKMNYFSTALKRKGSFIIQNTFPSLQELAARKVLLTVSKEGIAYHHQSIPLTSKQYLSITSQSRCTYCRKMISIPFCTLVEVQHSWLSNPFIPFLIKICSSNCYSNFICNKKGREE